MLGGAMPDGLEKVLARALKRRARSAVARPLTIHRVRQRAHRLLLAEQLTGALALLVFIGVVWWRLRG
jgi:hypothetical protein